MANKKPISAVAQLLAGETLEAFDESLLEEENISEAEYRNSSESVLVGHRSQKVDNTKELEYIDCKQIKPWKYADRPENEMYDIDSLAESIKANGQKVPVLVRKSGAHYDLIYGNRRWRACCQLEIDVLAQVDSELDDRSAAMAQHIENDNRESISDLAKARQYQRLLNEGVFKSKNDLCQKLNIKKATLSDIMSFLRIPDQISVRIPNLNKLSRRMAIAVSNLCNEKENLSTIELIADRIGIAINDPKALISAMKGINNSVPSSITSSTDINTISINKKHKKDGSIHLTVHIPSNIAKSINSSAIIKKVEDAIT